MLPAERCLCQNLLMLQPRVVLYGLAERRIVFHERVSATAIASIAGLAQQITGTAAPLRHQEVLAACCTAAMMLLPSCCDIPTVFS